MSNKKIDELFRSKLADHAGAPSPEAWAKLQNKMNASGRRKGILWMPVAAAIALLLTTGWFAYRVSVRPAGMKETIAKTTPAPEPETSPAADTTQQPLVAANEPAAEIAAEKPKTRPQTKIDKAVQPAPAQKASTPKTEATKEEVPVIFDEVTEIAQVSTEPVAPELIEVESAELEIGAPGPVAQPMIAREVKITFKADDEEGFLDPVKELIDSDKEKKGGLNKLFASARTLGNRDILAELRDTKDELFSGNLKIGIIKNEKVNNSK